jgi:hypothetical protein
LADDTSQLANDRDGPFPDVTFQTLVPDRFDETIGFAQMVSSDAPLDAVASVTSWRNLGVRRTAVTLKALGIYASAQDFCKVEKPVQAVLSL